MSVEGRLLLVDIASNIIENTYAQYYKVGLSTEFHVSMLAFFCSALRIGTERQTSTGKLVKSLHEKIREMESMQRTHKDFRRTRFEDAPIERAAAFMAFRKPALERLCRWQQHLKWAAANDVNGDQ